MRQITENGHQKKVFVNTKKMPILYNILIECYLQYSFMGGL